ncbi:hypothetical protein ACI6PS_07355 [Flavobacterium sp. PLA-1-15]|uniref:hypothetical protein n=1 Tax=Flavobacterium sp. PLA-1-15 TaxID=3380533 RepID=UPI003B7CBA9E
MATTDEHIDFNFVKPTLYFSIAGLFMSGFTLFFMILLQIALERSGVGCTAFWYNSFLFSGLLAILLPVLFCLHIKHLPHKNGLLLKIILFNALEYFFIQIGLGHFSSDVKMLCHGSDGQNGLELVFNGWLALPVLISFAFLFNYLLDVRNTSV